MELTILGANGTYPTAEGACSGYLLEHDGYRIWMDAGNGTMSRLQQHVSLGDVDAIFLSHVHPDHCADIYPYFYALLMEPRTVPLFVPPGAQEKLERLIGLDSRESFGRFLDWNVLEPGDVTETGPFRIEAFDASHSIENTTARFTAGGRTLCYTGDTGPNEWLAKAANAAELFLCEASWLEHQTNLMAPIHLMAREAGEAARAAGPARLMLTHIWPHNDLSKVREEVSAAFDGSIELAVETDRTHV